MGNLYVPLVGMGLAGPVETVEVPQKKWSEGNGTTTRQPYQSCALSKYPKECEANYDRATLYESSVSCVLLWTLTFI